MAPISFWKKKNSCPAIGTNCTFSGSKLTCNSSGSYNFLIPVSCASVKVKAWGAGGGGSYGNGLGAVVVGALELVVLHGSLGNLGLAEVREALLAEAMVALVLAEAVLEKFGGDSVTETRRNFESYRA